MDLSPTAEKIVARLSATLGPHTARVAVATFARKSLNRGPETLAPEDVPALLTGLKPMLNTLVGARAAAALAEAIVQEVNL